jgi:hypothetical protein
MDVRGPSWLPRGHGSPIIDPTEWRGMAVGAPVGLVTGGVVGSLFTGNAAMRQGLQGTRAMDDALLRGGVLGALAGITAGVLAGFLVGHVQDEGWTLPGS